MSSSAAPSYESFRARAILHRLGWLSVPSVPLHHQAGVENNQKNFPYLEIAFMMSLFIFLFEQYLAFRQLRRFKAVRRDDDVPADIKAVDEKGEISQEKFQKSVAYGIDKSKFGIMQANISFIRTWLYFCLGFYPFLWDLGERLVLAYLPGRSNLAVEMYTSYAFVVLSAAIGTICDMPFNLYYNFVIEERHGFNKQTLSTFFTDILKAQALTLLFSPIVSGFVWVVRSTGDNFYFYVWLFVFVVQIFIVIIYPVFIAPLFNKFTPFEETKYASLKASIDVMANRLKFPLTKIYVIDGSIRSSHSNAYLYGFFNNKRVVLYDTLLEADANTGERKVSDEEIIAILGHEMGHWKLSHTIEALINTQAYLFFTFYLFSNLRTSVGLNEAFGFRSATCPVIISLVLFGETFGKLIDQIMSMYMTYRTRCNEYAADSFAVELGHGTGLKSGLVKLNIDNLGNMVPDKYYAMYHNSHPTLVERVNSINWKMQKEHKRNS